VGLTAGTRLGPYEITSPIGAGGMGEVYRARDTRLDRTVAIKVLPAGARDRPDLRARFEREARAVSALSHPHICVLHDVGRQDQTDYLVMEYLEGETLSARIARGPLPQDEALRYAVQIAQALAHAHQNGVFHRDLKPGNVMLTKSGAKLLDFGLAKTAAVSSDVTQLTASGTIVGTVQYMSPEQLEGKDSGAAADLFAFGAVLYEMLTGQKAFGGPTQASVIAGILERQPPELQALPEHLRRILAACLAKDPADRWQSARDLSLALEWTAPPAAVAPVPAPAGRGARLAWAAAGLLAAAAAVLAVVHFREVPPDLPVARFAIAPPEKARFAGSLSVAPDGRRAVFRTVAPDGRVFLSLRSLDSQETTPIPGTDGATYNFWSPDARFLAFFAGSQLKRLELTAAGAGPAQVIAEARGTGGSWNREGIILYGGSGRPLRKVSVAGGESADVTRLDEKRRESHHRFPHFLPDGRRFLFLAVCEEQQNNALFVGDLDGGAPRLVLPSDTAACYAAGRLFFLREGRLYAQRFDLDTLQLSGEPVLIAERVGSFISGEALFEVSPAGLLVYRVGRSDEWKLIWVTRDGKETDVMQEPGLLVSPRLSPDDSRVAYERLDPQTRNSDLWILDLARGARTRFTFDPAADSAAVWSPDGRRIAYSSSRKGVPDLYWRDAAGAAPEELLLESKHPKWPDDWSPDARYLVFTGVVPGGSADLFALPLEGERRPIPLVQTPFDEWNAAVSPDGRLFAYMSNESGSPQIYVRTFEPGSTAGGKWQVSIEGGANPTWSHDGRELFYVGADSRITAAPVRTRPTFEAGVPQPLFPSRIPPVFQRNSFEVSRDGKRFLMNRDSEMVREAPTFGILNWVSLPSLR
jgi:Tol biopolymer transport system component